MNSFKIIFDRIFKTTYDFSVIKKGNPVNVVIRYNSFLYTNFSIFFFNIISIFFKFKPLKPYWFLIILLVIYVINYFYYISLNKKDLVINNIELKKIKYLDIILLISYILNFSSYYYLIEKN